MNEELEKLIRKILGDFPQGFNAGVVAGVPGWAGDIGYLLQEYPRALLTDTPLRPPVEYTGTTDNIAKAAGYEIPGTLSGQLGAAVGGLLSPGPGDLARFAPLLAGVMPVADDAARAAGLLSAPADARIETARKNAVSMLGLPENNTAMDRARAMGFGSEQFHETTAPKLSQIAQEGFDPRKAIAAASDNETPYGVFTKDTGRSIGLASTDEVQLPLLVRTGEGTPAYRVFMDRADLNARLGVWNPEIARLQAAQNMDEAARARQIDALGDTLGTRLHPNTSGKTNAEIWKQIDELAAGDEKLSAQTKELITKALEDQGISTIRLAKDAGSMGRNTDTTISLNPAAIRSRFAAFDPARINQNDLLASLAALGILTTGGMLSAEDKKKKEFK